MGDALRADRAVSHSGAEYSTPSERRRGNFDNGIGGDDLLHQRLPSPVATETGFVVAFLDSEEFGLPEAYGIPMVVHLNELGEPTGPPVALAGTDTVLRGKPVLASMDSARMVAVWSDEENGNPAIVGRFITTGAQLSGLELALTTRPDDIFEFPVAVGMGEAGFAAAWLAILENDLVFELQRFDATGQAVGNPTRIVTLPETTFIASVELAADARATSPLCGPMVSWASKMLPSMCTCACFAQRHANWRGGARKQCRDWVPVGSEYRRAPGRFVRGGLDRRVRGASRTPTALVFARASSIQIWLPRAAMGPLRWRSGLRRRPHVLAPNGDCAIRSARSPKGRRATTAGSAPMVRASTNSLILSCMLLFACGEDSVLLTIDDAIRWRRSLRSKLPCRTSPA